MAEVQVHADELTRAYVEVTEERLVPRLVITCGDSRIEFTPGQDIAGLGDVAPGIAVGATVIARAAAEWRDRLLRLGQASSVIGERFSS